MMLLDQRLAWVDEWADISRGQLDANLCLRGSSRAFHPLFTRGWQGFSCWRHAIKTEEDLPIEPQKHPFVEFEGHFV